MSGAQFLLIAVSAAVIRGAVALAALLARSRRGGGGGPMIEQPRALPPLKGSLDAAPGGRPVGVALGREILPLLEEGKLEEAAAVVSGRTGRGREEARAAVGRLGLLKKRLGM